MGNEVGEACEKCQHKCLLMHGKNRKHTASTPPIISFFKIMIGDKFSKFMYLPPKFSRTVSNLVGQKVYLEDSNGQQWGVTVSKINGSIAFKQGWQAFSSDHGLQFGEFVVFHYVTGSNFVVQIFDKTGCEKVDFSEEDYNNKRSRTDNNCISKDVPSHTSDKSSMNKQGSSTSAVSKSDIEMNQNQCDVNNEYNVHMATKSPLNCVNSNERSLPVLKAEYMEESYFMINRESPCKQGEDRSSIFDLSHFEMHVNTSVVADRSNEHLVGNESSSLQGDMLLEPRPEAVSVGKDPVAREMPSNASQFQTCETNDDFGAMPKIFSKNDSCNRETTKIILTTSVAKPRENKKDCPDVLNKVIKRCQIAARRKNASTEPLSGDNQIDVSQKERTPYIGGSPNIPQEVTGVSELPQFPVPSRPRNCQNGERIMAIKPELTELTPGHCSHEEMIQGICGKEPKAVKGDRGQSFNLTRKESYKVVKTEPIDTAGLFPPIASNVSCLVSTNNQSYLELPACWPSYKGKMKANGNVVYLQDPVMRMWPVVYHERYNFKVLTTGWEAFSTANSIQQGDECLFEVESASEGTYKVCIIRRF